MELLGIPIILIDLFSMVKLDNKIAPNSLPYISEIVIICRIPKIDSRLE